MNSCIRLLTIFSALILLPGCSAWRFYEIESSWQVKPSEIAAPKSITASRDFSQLHPKLKTLAVRAPALCRDLGHADSSGINRKRDTVLHAQCGQEMAYIERALLAEGYNVISWKFVDSLVRASVMQQGGQIKTPLEVAREMSADALLVVNSLERSAENSVVTDWQHQYFKSDKHGARGKEIKSAKYADGRLREAISMVNTKTAKQWSLLELPSANLSVTLTSTATGDLLWLYEAAHMSSHHKPLAGIISTKWACKPQYVCKRWGTPEERKQLKRQPDSYSVVKGEGRSLGDDRDYDMMIKSLVAEMASDLKQGKVLVSE